MSKYNKHTWRNGELITADRMNAIENQLETTTPGATIIANDYNSSTTYNIGDYCLYNGGLWRCIAQSTGNAPEEGMYWTNTILVEELNNGVDASIASAYSTTKTYHINDYVIYDNKLYRNIYNGTTSGSWNSDKWEETILGDDVTDALDALDGLGSAALDTAYEALAAATSAIDEVEALTSDIADAIASIPSDYDDLLATLATDFSAGTYSAGQYVWYNGTLYRFTAAHSGSWTGTDVEAVVIGDELTNLKNAFNNQLRHAVQATVVEYQQGLYGATGGSYDVNQSNAICNVDYIPLADVLAISCSNSYKMRLQAWNNSNVYQGVWNGTGWQKSNPNYYQLSFDLVQFSSAYSGYKFKIALFNADGTTAVTPQEATNIYYTKYVIPSIQDEIEALDDKINGLGELAIIPDMYGTNASVAAVIPESGGTTTVSWDAATKTASVSKASASSAANSVGVMMAPKLDSGKTFKVVVEYGYESGADPITYVRACNKLTNHNTGVILLNAQRRESGDLDVFTFTSTESCWIGAFKNSVAAASLTSFYYKIAVYDVTGIDESFVPDSLFTTFPDSVTVVVGGVIKKIQDEMASGGQLSQVVAKIRNGDYTSQLTGTGSINFGSLEIGDTVDISPIINQVGTAHYTLHIDDVESAERFEIKATDGNGSRPWAFLDSDYKLLSMAYNAYADGIEIVAPVNAKYLIVQVGSAYLANAYVIRKRSLSYISDGDKAGINEVNDITDTTNKIVNAVSVAKGDGTTAVKSRTNLFTLLHFSDVHGDTRNIQRILEFDDKYDSYIMDILHTGDGVTTYFSSDNPFAAIGGDRILNVVGNHECWIQGETWPRPYTATAAQVYEKFFAPYISSWDVTSPGENLCYYYKDYSTAKVRLIVLDCIHYDATQEAWFQTVLSGAITAEYRVVAVTHYPAITGLTDIQCTFNTYGESISPVQPPSGTDQVERMPESAFDCVDNFIDDGGEFVCWLSGHTHADFIGKVTGHTNQIQVIITQGRTYDGNGDAARIYGTKSQDAFNVFVVDGNNKLFKLIRIGADKNRYMQSRQTLCINYTTGDVVSNT